MLKKVSCMLLVMAMLLSLGACKSSKEDTSSIVYLESEVVIGSDSKDNASNASSKETSSRTKIEKVDDLSKIPSNLKGTTITVYSWNAATDVSGASNVIKKFQNQTGIKIKWSVGSYDNYKSEIAAMVAAKNSPDVIRLRGYEPGILSLLDPVSVSGYEFKENTWDKFVEGVYTIKGKVYGVNRKNTLLQQPLVMFYNKDLMTKYDLGDPYALWKQNKKNWNWEKFFDLCNAYKKAAGPDSKPWMTNGYKDYAWTFGSNILKRNGDAIVSNMNDSNLLIGYQKFAQLRMDGIAFTGWDMNGFNTDNYLFFGPSIISARRTHFDLKDMKSKGSLGVVPYPCVSGQSTYYQNVYETEAYGIPKGAKNAAAVPYFLNYYLNGDNYDKNTFFNDKKILDVYNYCMNETTLVSEYDRWILDVDSDRKNYARFASQLSTATPEQVAGLVSSFAPAFASEANEASADIAKIG